MMRTALVSVIGLCIPNFVSAVWPAPSRISNGTQVLWLSPDIVTTYHAATGYAGTHSTGNVVVTDQEIIQSGLQRFKDDILPSTFVPWMFYGKRVNFEPSTKSKVFLSSITIQQTSNSRPNDTNGPDESYTLSVPSNGKVVITAASAVGGLHALNTLTQLFYKHSSGGVYMSQAPLTIQDSPTYSHRGLNLDISRHYTSPQTVESVIDSLAFTKINRLHLHATDSQSWPLEIPALPALATQGAYRPDEVWSPSTLASVQRYAALRGIQSFIEIDSPGHTASVAYSQPDLIAGFNQQPWSFYANEPPSGQVKLNSPAVYTFFDKLYDDLLPRVKAFAPFFHTGGDELNVNIYTLDPTVKSNSSTVIQPLLQKFVSHLHRKIASQGMTPIVWEEILLQWNLTLSSETVVQTWLGPESLNSVLGKGHRAIFGDYDHWYLDCGFGQWVDPNTTTGSQTPIVPPYADYCSPYKSWREVYSYDPLVNLTYTDRTHLILGGEVHMWRELTDASNLDGKLWPRVAAAAEVMWSGGKGVSGVDYHVTRRLADFRERLVGRGVAASVVQMTWCLQNPGDCQL